MRCILSVSSVERRGQGSSRRQPQLADQAAALWGEERVHYADFTDGFRPPKFDAVITNPSFGKVFGHSDAALDFLNRIADLSSAGMRVAAILPRDYMKKDRPKANAALRKRYTVLDEIEMPATPSRR